MGIDRDHYAADHCADAGALAKTSRLYLIRIEAGIHPARHSIPGYTPARSLRGEGQRLPTGNLGKKTYISHAECVTMLTLRAAIWNEGELASTDIS